MRGFDFSARDFLQQVVMNVECDRFFSCVSSLCPGPQRATSTYNHRFCQTSVAEGKAAKLLRVKGKGDYNDGPQAGGTGKRGCEGDEERAKVAGPTR